VISDGKPGHENQSLGLAEAMGRLQEVNLRLIRLEMGMGLFRRMVKLKEMLVGYGRPDYVIGAGHGTHMALLWVSMKYDAYSIVLMKPGLPMCLFGWCVAPEHDFKRVPSSEGLILSKGALNRVKPSDGKREGKLILIGGASKIHGFDEEGLMGQISKVATGGGWMVADSRRTPGSFLEKVKRQIPEVEIFPHQETKHGWLAGELGRVEEVWVTEDSVSMIYEALTGGGRVGVLAMPRLKEDARVIRGLERLREEGYFLGGEGEGMGSLAEADRCARFILDEEANHL